MRREWVNPAAVTSAFLLLPLVVFAAYVAGYFWLGTRLDISNDGDLIIVFFDEPWLDEIYSPAAKVEELATGRQVLIWEVSSE